MAGYTGSIADAGRVIHIAKRRERQREDLELKRRKIAEENQLSSINDKFAAHYDAVENQLKAATVGLVTLEEMKAKRQGVLSEREKQLAHKKPENELKLDDEAEIERKRQENLEKHKQRACMSFDIDFEDEDDESEEEAPASSSQIDLERMPIGNVIKKEPCDIDTDSTTEDSTKKKKIGKDPTVDTSFLPDRDREEEENRLREKLRQEWVEEQEKAKNEEINIAFSYWDGSGHRRDVKMKKGASIHQFLNRALDILKNDFNELKLITADSLMFVKEDLIIPHFYTFHDFIVTKAKGKTGPLFEFDAAGDLRIRQDAAVDREESHPAKVVHRSWYERNKHIYPASRWEPFDPKFISSS